MMNIELTPQGWSVSISGGAFNGGGGGGGSSGPVSSDIPFATAVPLTSGGIAYMPAQYVSSVLAFTPGASPVKNSQAYVVLIADGVNAPTFTGFKEWGGSLGYDNRAGIANQVQFFYDGFDKYYSVSQLVGAVPVPSAAASVTLTGPAGGVVSMASSNFTVGVAPVGGAITGTLRVTPSDGGAGGTFAPAYRDLTTATPSGTFTYTPASTGGKTISVTNNGGLNNPANIAFTVTAAATAPGAPTIGTATGGDASASVAFTAPSNDGGAAILDYTVTASPGGATATGATSPIIVTGLTNGTAHTFTVKARNAVGSSVASAASNSVTPAAAAAAVARYGQLGSVTESGASPNYIYTATSGAGTVGYSGYGILTTKFQSGVDGSVAQRFPAALVNAFIWGLSTSATPVNFGSLSYGIYVNAGGDYSVITGGSIGTPSPGTGGLKFAANDLMRLQRVGTTINAQFSKNNGSSWTTFHTWSSASTAALYVNLNLNDQVVVDQIVTAGFA